MKIAVVGSGYVGLVAGACFAENGNDVVCIDKDPVKIKKLQRGQIPIYEPGLEEMVRRNRAEKRLTFTTNLARGVRASEIIFIAVGTPTGEDGSADLKHVLDVAREAARAMNGYRVIVIRIAGTDRSFPVGPEGYPLARTGYPSIDEAKQRIADFRASSRRTAGRRG